MRAPFGSFCKEVRDQNTCHHSCKVLDQKMATFQDAASKNFLSRMRTRIDALALLGRCQGCLGEAYEEIPFFVAAIALDR